MVILICRNFNTFHRSISVIALKLKSKELCYHVRVVDGTLEVVEMDITKSYPFLESKPRDVNVACVRYGSAVVSYICGYHVINID